MPLNLHGHIFTEFEDVYILAKAKFENHSLIVKIERITVEAYLIKKKFHMELSGEKHPTEQLCPLNFDNIIYYQINKN